MANYAVSTAFNGLDNISSTFRRMSNSADAFSKKAQNSFRSASSSALSFKSIMGGILGANLIQQGIFGIGNAFKFLISETTKIEDSIAGFTPLLGSVAKANQLVEELNKTAATTPYQFEGISSVAKALLPVMNGSIENTIKTFRMLGDTAGGNMQKLESITRGYTKALLKGKPDMESFNMIAEAGVPIFTEMAKSMGVTQKQFFELSKRGKITTGDLTKAFEKMTSSGGVFFNGMQIASETLSGRWSTFKDNIAITAATIGQQLLPVIKPLLDMAISLTGKILEYIQANKEIIKSRIVGFFKAAATAASVLWWGLTSLWSVLKFLAPVIITVGTAMLVYKGIMAGMAVAQYVTSFMALSKSIGFYNAALKSLTIVQRIYNFVMMANPIGLIIAGIAALIAIVWVLYENWDAVTGALKSAWEWMKRIVSMAAGPLSSAIEGVKGIFGFGNDKEVVDVKKDINVEQRQAPNAAEVSARNQTAFKGRLDIAGAPAGSNVTTLVGAKGFDISILGAN